MKKLKQTQKKFRPKALPPAIYLNSLSDLNALWPKIRATFNTYGFVIVVPPTDDKAVAVEICQKFGAIQGHARSPKDGVVDVCSTKTKNASARSIISDIEYFLHTDGISIDGVFRRNDNKLFRIGPPKIVALQCVKKADHGGDTILVDGAIILPTILDERPDIIPALFSHDSMGVWRKNHIAMRVPVFDVHNSGNFSMYFSCDTDTYGAGSNIKALNSFYTDYLSNPKFIKYLTLSERQILLFDNHRFLHGRTSIEGERLLRRIWIWDEQISQEMSHINVKGEMYERNYGTHENNILDQYRDYAPLDTELRNDYPEEIMIGIPLSKKNRRRIASLCMRNAIMRSQFMARAPASCAAPAPRSLHPP